MWHRYNQQKVKNMKPDLVKVEIEDFDVEMLCLSTKDACRVLGIGRTSFWKIADTLPAVRINGRRRWVRRGLERWIEANARTGATA
ncbi:helix-turn-helix domain-containing protein [Ferrovum sp.]|uniref:helix-turn-helix domain-containing protein n=1 Tax=Ferrovum sp. TaxID=2609467 RepID=UPI0026338925|nr:helix-turn-helix domain-containing protein [Ferrovum sp.]